MIPAIMLGVAAILFMLSVIGLQLNAIKPQNFLVSGGLILLFMLNLGVSALLVIGAMGSSINTY